MSFFFSSWNYCGEFLNAVLSFLFLIFSVRPDKTNISHMSLEAKTEHFFFLMGSVEPSLVIARLELCMCGLYFQQSKPAVASFQLKFLCRCASGSPYHLEDSPSLRFNLHIRLHFRRRFMRSSQVHKLFFFFHFFHFSSR